MPTVDARRCWLKAKAIAAKQKAPPIARFFFFGIIILSRCLLEVHTEDAVRTVASCVTDTDYADGQG